MKSSAWIVGAVLAAATATSGASSLLDDLQPTLKFGDKAPPLPVMAWIKGEPVTQFKPGHVYIVDFWATWCGVCIEGMPHLSALQKKYDGKLTVIGVDSREMAYATGDIDPAAVKATVEKSALKHSERMTYTVAMDHPVKEPVYETWQVASGGMRVPNAMIVDGNGVIVWNAPPTDQWKEKFDLAVDAAVKGKSDMALGRAVFNEQYGDGMVSLRFYRKFINLFGTSETAAMDYARAVEKDPEVRKALREAGPDPMYWGMIAFTLGSQKKLSPALAAEAAGYAEKLVAYRTDVPAWYLGLASLYYRAGQYDKGAAMEKTMLQKFRESGMDDKQLTKTASTLDPYRKH